MTTTDLGIALHKLAEAQAEVEQAQKVHDFEKQFPETGELHLVIARKPEFHQFVSYSIDGIPVAAFSEKQDAESYIAGAEAPTGYYLVVETLPLRAAAR